MKMGGLKGGCAMIICAITKPFIIGIVKTRIQDISGQNRKNTSETHFLNNSLRNQISTTVDGRE